MVQMMISAVALVALGGLALAGCGSGGGDPRNAPGCTVNAYRCDRDVVQLCQHDAAERRNKWWEVEDCVELGHDLGRPMTCVESDAGDGADCEYVLGDGEVARGHE